MAINMSMDPGQYRFQCGILRFTVDAINEEHAWSLAEDFVINNTRRGVKVHAAEYDDIHVYNVVMYPEITNGLVLVDGPDDSPRRLVVDECPDAAGHWTVRRADGTENGDTSTQPIATFYDREMADAYVRLHHRAHGVVA